MINVLSIVAALLFAKEVVAERIEPVAPKGTRFDWAAYWHDANNGIAAMEQVRKRQSGGYATTMPPQINPVLKDGVVDQKRYQHDKRTYGEAIAEMNRQNGAYAYVRPY